MTAAPHDAAAPFAAETGRLVLEPARPADEAAVCDRPTDESADVVGPFDDRARAPQKT